jgi:lysophospholipase L1-like esterase
VLCLCAAETAASDFYLRDGDTVLFHGDSITEGRIYDGFVESYVVTRFPKIIVRFVHHGWGGDQVTGGPGGPIDVRLDRDVIPWKPTVVAIMLGMNDGRYKAFDQEIFSSYSNGFTHIIRRIKQALPGVRITALRPSPFDEVARPAVPHSYNAVLVRFGDFIQELSGREKLLVADLNAPIVAAVEKAKAIDAEAAGKLIGDRVHPDRAIHLLMAGELLKAWNAPAIVSSVEIDAAGGRVTSAENTAVTGFSAGTAIRWTQFDNALPIGWTAKIR